MATRTTRPDDAAPLPADAPAPASPGAEDSGLYETSDAMLTMVEAFDRYWLLGGLFGLVG